MSLAHLLAAAMVTLALLGAGAQLGYLYAQLLIRRGGDRGAPPARGPRGEHGQGGRDTRYPHPLDAWGIPVVVTSSVPKDTMLLAHPEAVDTLARDSRTRIVRGWDPDLAPLPVSAYLPPVPPPA